MRHLLVLAVLGITGAHFPATLHALQNPGPPAAYGEGWADESLRAAVWFDEYSGVASFDINRPAHVALFALQPLGRIEMIYPHGGGDWGWGVSGERVFRAGLHSVRADSRMYRLTARRGHRPPGSRWRGQTYILMIASERPLDLERFLATGTVPWLNHPAVTWNPFIAIEHLADEVVRGRRSGEWTTAYHVIWPDADLYRYDGRIPHTRVRCPGGAAFSIPTQAIRVGAWRCPDRYPPQGAVARPGRPRTPPITSALPDRRRPADRPGASPRSWPSPMPGKDRARPAPPAGPVVPRLPDRARPAAPPVTRPRPRPAAKPGGAGTKAKPIPKTRPKKGGGGSV